jgi:AhpD family alkylhydroperoxidase
MMSLQWSVVKFTKWLFSSLAILLPLIVKSGYKKHTIANEKGEGQPMQPRFDYSKIAPETYRAMLGLEKTINDSGLDAILLDLLRLRVSQINGCAYCIDMHAKDLRARGESEQRIYLLNAWRESPFYSQRERSALDWAEALTEVSQKPVSDELYEQARQYFSEAELANLTLAVVSINGWNRLNIAFKAVPGGYQPAALQKATD